MTKKRPDVLSGKTYKIKVEGCATMYSTLNCEEGKLCEIMLNVGKKGSCQNTCFYIAGVLLSIMFELGASKDKIIKTIRKHFIGVKCDAGESCFHRLGERIIKELESEKETKEAKA